MQATEPHELDELVREAARHAESKENDKAEGMYRETGGRRLEH